MSRKRKAPRKKAQGAPTSPAKGKAMDRRSALRLLRNGGIGLAVAGGVGVFSVNAVRATVREQDLGRIGGGVPMVVQVHDPSCRLCTELQRNTRRALRAFDEADLQYVVANINTPEGGALAGRYGVEHVTLLLFDGAGEMRQVLHGVRQKDELRGHFEAHLARTTGS